MPNINKVKIIFGISKGKKLNDIISFLEDEEIVTDLHLVSRPHMRLYKVEDAFKIIHDIGSKKLRDLVYENDVLTTKSDTSDSSLLIDQGNNVGKTIDHLLAQLNESPDHHKNTLILVCGSFFIMSDVQTHFGYKIEVDNI
jgi:folylpolyglutamate synthase/dihydropteroate synthase